MATEPELPGIPIALTKDPTLSLRAKGLYAVLVSLPEEADTTARALTARLREGEDAVRTTMRELRESGWITREPTRDKGKFVWSWSLNKRPIPPAETPSGRAA